MSGRFELDEDSEGSVFEVLLSRAYFNSLAERYPDLFGVYLEKMLRQEAFWLSPERLPTTLTMRSIMQRVRRREIDHAAGSLFLESQVLELLALQLGQLEAPPACRSGRSLARADVDKMYEAGRCSWPAWQTRPRSPSWPATWARTSSS